jgi:polysaccharide biosynthesis protein PslG
VTALDIRGFLVLIAALVLWFGMPPARAAERLLGVHHLFDNTRIPADRQLEFATGIGAQAVRIGVSWATLQPTRAEIGDPNDTRNFVRLTDNNTWTIDQIDKQIIAASARGLKIIVVIAEAPCWANTRGSDCDEGNAEHRWYPPRLEEMTSFAKAFAWVVQRYRWADQIIAWEVWNEPNSIPFWRSGQLRKGTYVLTIPDNARTYTRLLNTTYELVKRMDRKLVILGGSLAGVDLAYMDVMYRARAKYDGFSVHPYSKARPGTARTEWPEVCSPGDPLQPPWCFVEIERMRARMVERGEANKDIWITEFGATARDPQGFDDTGGEGPQGEYLARALKMIDGWCYVRVAMVYRLFDSPSGGDYAGLFHEDGTEKPAARAVAAHAKTKNWQTCPQ